MIELYAYEKLEEQLLTKLEERLKKAGVVFVPILPNTKNRTGSKISQRESNPVRPIFTPHVSAKFGNHGANEYF